MELHTIGIDLGKTVFHLVGLNLRGEVVVRKKFSRKQLLHFTANLQVKLIGMEACGGSHFLGRALREQGHEVRLMPAQYVKPYVKTNKSDYIDAEAIAEAVGRPKMRFVPIKSDDQLDLQSLHRVRERWVMRRTAVINQIRGLLLERGITLRQGRRHIDDQNAVRPIICRTSEMNSPLWEQLPKCKEWPHRRFATTRSNCFGKPAAFGARSIVNGWCCYQ